MRRASKLVVLTLCLCLALATPALAASDTATWTFSVQEAFSITAYDVTFSPLTAGFGGGVTRFGDSYVTAFFTIESHNQGATIGSISVHLDQNHPSWDLGWTLTDGWPVDPDHVRFCYDAGADQNPANVAIMPVCLTTTPQDLLLDGEGEFLPGHYGGTIAIRPGSRVAAPLDTPQTVVVVWTVTD